MLQVYIEMYKLYLLEKHNNFTMSVGVRFKW